MENITTYINKKENDQTPESRFLILLALAFIIISSITLGIKVFILLASAILVIMICLKLDRLLYLYVFTLPFIGLCILNTFFKINIGTGVQPSYLFALLLFLIFVFNLFLTNFKFRLPRSKVHLLIILFLFVGICSLFMSLFISHSEFKGEVPFIKSIKQLIQLALMVMMYFVIVIFLNSEEKLKKSIIALLISGFVVSCYGIYQFIGYYYDLPFTNLFSSNVGIITSEDSKLFIGSSFLDVLRIRSTTPEPAMFGNFLLCVIPIQFILLLNKCYSNKKTAMIFSIFLVTMFLALMLTFSKGGYLSISIALLLIIWQLRKKIDFKKLLIKVLIGVILIMVIFGFLGVIILENETMGSTINLIVNRAGQVFNISDVSNLTRLYTYEAAIKMTIDYPIIGVGIGNFGFYYYDYRPSTAHDEQFYWPVSNNLFLRVLSEMGFLGFILFALILFFLYQDAKLNIRMTKNDTYWNSISIGLLASATGILFHFLTIDTFNFSHFWFLIAAIVSLKGILFRINLRKD